MILKVSADCMALPLKSEKQPHYVKKLIPTLLYQYNTLESQVTGNHNLRYKRKNNGTDSQHWLITW